MSCMRFVLLVLNLVMIGIGSLLIYFMYMHINILSDKCKCYIGGIIALNIILGLYGICITLKTLKRGTAVCVYVLLVLLFIAGQIVGKIYITSIDANDSKELAKNKIKAAWENFVKHDSNEMEAFEIQNECCGLNGIRDYSLTPKKLPSHCFNDKDVPYKGCSAVVKDVSNSNFEKFIYSEIGSIVTNAISFIFGLLYACSYSNNPYIRFILNVFYDTEDLDIPIEIYTPTKNSMRSNKPV